MIVEETTFGFNWGALIVERMCSDERKGWVILGVRAGRRALSIYVTKTGRVRVFEQIGNNLTGRELK